MTPAGKGKITADNGGKFTVALDAGGADVVSVANYMMVDDGIYRLVNPLPLLKP